MTQATQTTPKKHQEFILAVSQMYFTEYMVNNKLTEADGETFRRVVPFDFLEFCEKATPKLIIAQRAGLEVNSAYRQLLPYLVLTQKDAEGNLKYLNYNRAKGSGESRLLGGRSCGFGGHIDWEDLVNLDESGSINLSEVILKSLDRETNEELTVKYGSETISCEHWLMSMRIGYMILSKDESVGIYHVGLVVEAEVHPELNFTSDEDAIAMAEPATFEELLYDPKLEDWSRLFLEFKHNSESDYSANNGFTVKRKNPLNDMVELIGLDTFRLIETLMGELLEAQSDGEKETVLNKLKEISFVNIINTEHGYRWSFNEAAYHALQINASFTDVPAEETTATAEVPAVEGSSSEEALIQDALSDNEFVVWVESKIADRQVSLISGDEVTAEAITKELNSKMIELIDHTDGTYWKHKDSSSETPNALTANG